MLLTRTCPKTTLTRAQFLKAPVKRLWRGRRVLERNISLIRNGKAGAEGES